MFIKFKVKRRLIEKLRIVYKTGYIHEMWVYNLKVSKEGQYTWTHYKQSNRIIDLQPDQISSIFVIKSKKVFYISKIKERKKKPQPTVLETFKPKKSVPFRELNFVPVTKVKDGAKAKDDIKIVMTRGRQKTGYKYEHI